MAEAVKQKCWFKNGLEFEIVPGITSGIAAPAYAGIPVTHREWSQSFAMITGHCLSGKPKNIRWDHLAHGVDTLAIYMGVKHLPFICSQLISCGKESRTPIAVIEQGTTGNQRTVVGTLETIVEVVKENRITNPAMIVIGEVVENYRRNYPGFRKESKKRYLYKKMRL